MFRIQTTIPIWTRQYEVVYLPVYYVLEKFQAQLANDSMRSKSVCCNPDFNESRFRL